MEKIAVSACLLGRNCKYNGGNNRNEAVLAFCQGKQVIPVCPEVLAGLPTPRTPMELVKGRMTTWDGADVQEAMEKAVETLLRQLQQEGVSRAVLQSRSPSCGVLKIYDGTFTGKKIEGSGLFAQRLKEAGFDLLDAEEIGSFQQKENMLK